MAGLSLRTGVSASYSPMTPPASNTPTAAPTIAQAAYGVQGTGMPQVSPIPGFGAVGAGVAATLILVYLWWSLPR